MKKGKTKKNIIKKSFRMPEEPEVQTPASSAMEYDSLPTSASGTPSGDKWTSEDLTTAPKIGEADKTSAKPASLSYADLIKEYILNKQSFFVIFIFVIFGAIFLQDNQAGSLKDWQGVFWSLKKTGFAILIGLLILFVQNICFKIKE